MSLAVHQTQYRPLPARGRTAFDGLGGRFDAEFPALRGRKPTNRHECGDRRLGQPVDAVPSELQIRARPSDVSGDPGAVSATAGVAKAS